VPTFADRGVSRGVHKVYRYNIDKVLCGYHMCKANVHSEYCEGYRGYLLKKIRNSENLKILSNLFYGNYCGNNIKFYDNNPMSIFIINLLVNTKF